MAHAVVCVSIWCAILILIPIRRIYELRMAVAISIVWMIIVDNVSIALGYYSYARSLISIGKASLFQLLGVSGIGILMLNWLNNRPLSKLRAVITVACAFTVVQFIYMRLGAFRYERLDVMLCFVHSVAALAVFVWLTKAALGEEKICMGKKTRDSVKMPANR